MLQMDAADLINLMSSQIIIQNRLGQEMNLNVKGRRLMTLRLTRQVKDSAQCLNSVMRL